METAYIIQWWMACWLNKICCSCQEYIFFTLILKILNGILKNDCLYQNWTPELTGVIRNGTNTKFAYPWLLQRVLWQGAEVILPPKTKKQSKLRYKAQSQTFSNSWVLHSVQNTVQGIATPTEISDTRKANLLGLAPGESLGTFTC